MKVHGRAIEQWIALAQDDDVAAGVEVVGEPGDALGVEVFERTPVTARMVGRSGRDHDWRRHAENRREDR